MLAQRRIYPVETCIAGGDMGTPRHHAEAQAKDKANWGYVGDLTALCEKLGKAAVCVTPNP